jgi:hypothetical protein
MKMKVLLLLMFSCFSAQAQFFSKNYFYANAGASLGNYGGVHLGLNYIYNNKHSLQLGLSSLAHKPFERNYELTENGKVPLQEIRGILSYELLYGRVLKLNWSRLNFRGGVIYSNNYHISEGSSFSGQLNLIQPGLILKPEIEFPITQVFGFALSSFALLNSHQMALGLEGKVIIGLLRTKKN